MAVWARLFVSSGADAVSAAFVSDAVWGSALSCAGCRRFVFWTVAAERSGYQHLPGAVFPVGRMCVLSLLLSAVLRLVQHGSPSISHGFS